MRLLQIAYPKKMPQIPQTIFTPEQSHPVLDLILPFRSPAQLTCSSPFDAIISFVIAVGNIDKFLFDVEI